MADKLWKAVERRIAKYLGGERVPITGRQRGSAPDIKHEWLSIEVKQRESLPAWVHDAMDQAVSSKRKSIYKPGEVVIYKTEEERREIEKAMRSQLPVVILHETGKRIEDDYVVIRLQDFRDWFVK